MSDKTIAQRVFDAQDEWRLAEEAASDAILDVLGCAPMVEQPDGSYEWTTPWGFEDFTWDSYDSSFELKQAEPWRQFSSDEWRQFRVMGFGRAWICYVDGSERYYYGDLAPGAPLSHFKVRRGT